MQEDLTQNLTPSPKNSALVPTALVALIAVAALAVYATRTKSPETQPSSNATSTTQASASPVIPSNSPLIASMSPSPTQPTLLQDGSYESEGNYISPGGPRSVKVALTIEDGVVTASNFEGFATDPASQRFQKEFGDNYQPMVVGKKLSEINLTKVSGSSLTPKGFMDALEKIKTEAQKV